jgi:hypothetical protein
MSENTINQALRTVGYSGNVTTAHEFPSIASTLCLLMSSRCGIPMRLSGNSLTRPAIRSGRRTITREHLPERRRMIQTWADYLDSLCARVRRGPRGKIASPSSIVDEAIR